MKHASPKARSVIRQAVCRHCGETIEKWPGKPWIHAYTGKLVCE